MKKLLVLLACAGASAVMAAPAIAGPGLYFGFSDDALKFEPRAAVGDASALGARAFRITLLWSRGQTSLDASDAADLDRAIGNRGGMRVVLALYGRSNTDAPTDDASREQYCAFARDVLARYPAVRDVVIWNEPNKQHFWKPQFHADGSSAAPAAYEALLAHCWDVLHAAFGNVNVIAAATSPRGNDRPNARSNVSHSPGAFIRGMGAAFEASGRQTRILDTVGHHAYGDHSAQRPWKEHSGATTISQGNWQALMQALHDAYDGTAQPIPGEEGTEIWYMEMGYQTTPDVGKADLYSGGENDPRPVVDEDGNGGWNDEGTAVEGDTLAPDQATQIVDALRLAFCQPYVGAFFNLQIWDERDLARWQSAPFWADRTRKGSWDAFRAAIAEIDAGNVDCGSLKGGPPAATFTPATGVAVEEIKWPKASCIPRRQRNWRFQIRPDEEATYVATLARLGKRGGTVATVEGALRVGTFPFVKFPVKKLALGRYRMTIELTSDASADRAQTYKSPKFSVKSSCAKPKAKKGKKAGRA